MFAAPIARVIEHRRRRPSAAEGRIVADIDPAAPRVGLALGQHGNRGVVPVKPLRRQHMGLDEAPQRVERCADGADGVGHGRQGDRRALERIAFGLTVQRLVLAELLKGDHRQKARPRPAARNDMERRRRLSDLLAVPAGELLPHGLHDLPLARRRLQRPRHILAELAQARAAAAGAGFRRLDHHALARQMVGEGVALRPLALEAGDRGRSGDRLFCGEFVFRCARFQLFEFERQLIKQPHRALRLLPVDLALQFGDLELLRGDQRHVFRRLRKRDGELRFQHGVFVEKGFGCGVHERSESQIARFVRAQNAADPSFFCVSPRALRPVGELRIPPVDPLEHIGHLRGRDRHRVRARRRPDELSAVEPLGVERQADPVVPEDFRKIAATPAENVEIARVRIALQLLLHLKRQALHAAPHVGVARRDPDPAARRQRDHRRSAFRTRDSAAVSISAHTMIRSPSASTISIWPVDPGAEYSVVVSGVIVTGRIGASSCGAVGSTPNCRRQVKSWLVLRSCRRATSAIEAPSSRLSSTIRRFSSRAHDRRLRRRAAGDACCSTSAIVSACNWNE